MASAEMTFVCAIIPLNVNASVFEQSKKRKVVI